MNIRVLFLATYFPRPTNARMGTWSLDHATALKSAGMEIKVVSLTPWFPSALGRLLKFLRSYSDCPAEAVLNDVPVVYPRWLCYPIKQCQRPMNQAPRLLMQLGWLSASQRILEIVRAFSPDVIVANHSMVSGFVAMQIQQQTGIPFITVDHEVGDFLGCSDSQRRLRHLNAVVSRAAASVTVSKTMQAMAESIVPEGRFQTIYNGAGFEECPIELLNRHKDKPDVTVFCCGNLYGRKDIPLLVRAFAAIAEEFPEACLRIAGDGPDRASIAQLVDSLSCRDRIQLLGSIEHSAVQQEMRSADVFALVGWAEPFGVVFLEAMASGCAVVVSADAGVAEILQHGETAMLTQPRDPDSVVAALKTLCQSGDMRRRIAEAGHRLYTESCRWHHRAMEYRRLLETVVAASSGDNSDRNRRP
jgi:glycosyltransferase involved in cell wall biosynthesis